MTWITSRQDHGREIMIMITRYLKKVEDVK